MSDQVKENEIKTLVTAKDYMVESKRCYAVSLAFNQLRIQSKEAGNLLFAAVYKWKAKQHYKRFQKNLKISKGLS